jgi:hypothetical protein
MAFVGFDVNLGDAGDAVLSDRVLARRDIDAKLPTYSPILGQRTLTGELHEAQGGGFKESYADGSFYWKNGLGAQCIWRPLYNHYIHHHGGAGGWLGYPVSSHAQMSDGIGYFTDFQAGSIYWTEATGAHEVHGEIRAKWLDHVGKLGYPVTDETGTPDGVGRFNHFERGSIYWTPDTGAHFVRGKIRDRWQERDWERGYLGYPISDEEEISIGATPLTIVRFQRGRIQMTADGRVDDVADSIVFESGPIETEETVGGRLSLRIDSLGHWTWEGHMHNSGFVALRVSVVTRMNFVNAAGDVFIIPSEEMMLAGTTSPGSRTHVWDKNGQDLRIRDNWEGLKNGGITSLVDIGTTAAEVVSLILLGVLVVGAVIFFGGPAKKSKVCRPIGGPEEAGTVIYYDDNAPEPDCPAGTQ